MPSISDLFKSGSIGEQLLVWGVLNQLISAAIAPAVSDITQAVNSLDAVSPLSPQELAAAVNRQFISASEGASEAAKSGIGLGRFAQLVDLAGDAPAPGLLAEALRRQIIPEAGTGADAVTFDQGIAEGNLRPKWTDMVKQLSISIPSIAEVMNAWLEGQIDETEANRRYLEAGGDPTWFQTSYNANGSAPTPMEALEMLNRGLIAETGTGPESTSYEQAFLEGPWRNKWEPAFRGLGIYVPPARTVTAMLKEGSVTSAQALAYFRAGGLSAETAAQYLAAASHTATAAQKELSQSQTIALYEDKLITRDEAHTELVALKYSPGDATLLLELADAKAAASATKSATTRIRTLYLAGHDDAATALSALHALGVPDDSATALLAVWDLERIASTKTLSAGQVESALYYGIIDQPTAQARLVAMGYTPHDAWIALSVRMHGAQPDEPPA